MINIRRDTFETNSSSVHSICISKEKPKNVPKHIVMNFDWYGWENNEVDAKNYLWTAILLLKSYEYKNRYVRYKRIPEIEKYIRSTLSRYGVEEVEFMYPKVRTMNSDGVAESYDSEPEIDHYDETAEFVDACLSDRDLLARAILSDSVVYTGNDNECDGDNWHYCAFNKIYDEDSMKMVKNPQNEPDKYDYFVKCN